MEPKLIFELSLTGMVLLLFYLIFKSTIATRFQNHWNEAVFKKIVHRSTRNDYIIANHINNQEVFWYVLNPFRNGLKHLYCKKVDKEFLLEKVKESLTK